MDESSKVSEMGTHYSRTGGDDYQAMNMCVQVYGTRIARPCAYNDCAYVRVQTTRLWHGTRSTSAHVARWHQHNLSTHTHTACSSLIAGQRAFKNGFGVHVNNQRITVLSVVHAACIASSMQERQSEINVYVVSLWNLIAGTKLSRIVISYPVYQISNICNTHQF